VENIPDKKINEKDCREESWTPDEGIIQRCATWLMKLFKNSRRRRVLQAPLNTRWSREGTRTTLHNKGQMGAKKKKQKSEAQQIL
jgi:hypothetical protein